jgi:hypothetical protein
MNTNRLLQDWSFTQVGGGEGTKDGEWLKTSEFPTTVHVELLKLKRIPDPVLSSLFVLVFFLTWIAHAVHRIERMGCSMFAPILT